MAMINQRDLDPRPRSKGPSVEEVAIARGLIKIHRPNHNHQEGGRSVS